MKKKFPVPCPVPPDSKYSGTKSSVMYVRVRSHVPFMFQLKSRLLMTGRLAATSQVWLSSVPAFCHCVVKPRSDGVGTWRISFFVRESALVSSMPRRSKRVKSAPNSVSDVVSGLSLLFPACASEQPVVPQLYVSYWAL